MADSAKDKGTGESSGLADIMEVAERIGSTNDAGYGVTPMAADAEEAPDLGAGYGSTAAAAVVVAEVPLESPAPGKRGEGAARSGESGRVVATPEPGAAPAAKK